MIENAAAIPFFLRPILIAKPRQISDRVASHEVRGLGEICGGVSSGYFRRTGALPLDNNRRI